MDQATEAPATVARDVRIDQIGFVNELVKQYTDPLKSKVKSSMADKQVSEATGDFFEAKVVTGTIGTVDPRKVYRLIKKGELTEAAFLDCIRVERGKLEEHLSGKDIDRLSEFNPSTPALRIVRKKGVELGLVDVVKSLSSAIIPA